MRQGSAQAMVGTYNNVRVQSALKLLDSFIEESNDEAARAFLQFMDLVFEAAQESFHAVDDIKTMVDRAVYAMAVDACTQRDRFVALSDTPDVETAKDE